MLGHVLRVVTVGTHAVLWGYKGKLEVIINVSGRSVGGGGRRDDLMGSVRVEEGHDMRKDD